MFGTFVSTVFQEIIFPYFLQVGSHLYDVLIQSFPISQFLSYWPSEWGHLWDEYFNKSKLLYENDVHILELEKKTINVDLIEIDDINGQELQYSNDELKKQKKAEEDKKITEKKLTL